MTKVLFVTVFVITKKVNTTNDSMQNETKMLDNFISTKFKVISAQYANYSTFQLQSNSSAAFQLLSSHKLCIIATLSIIKSKRSNQNACCMTDYQNCHVIKVMY